MKVTLLPSVEYAENYPTKGPAGDSHLNVNGRAATIEMMFGLAVMETANEGRRPPVRWSSYDKRIHDYQGMLEHKGDIQNCIMNSCLGHLVQYEPNKVAIVSEIAATRARMNNRAPMPAFVVRLFTLAGSAGPTGGG